MNIIKIAQGFFRARATKQDSVAPLPSSGIFAVRTVSATWLALKTGEKGLTEREVRARRQREGFNVIADQEKSDTWLKVVGRQFGSILILVLLMAMAASFLLGDKIDGQVILLAVLINVIVGAYQEKKASKALESLKRAVVTIARVWRDGKLIEVPQEELVVGDVVEVQAGDRVSADLRLIAVYDMEANESALTGESHPQAKTARTLSAVPPLAERTNMLFLGTTITAGRGRGVVVATGTRTEMGRIARLLAETKEDRTPLQHQLDQFARHLLLLILAVVAMMFFVGISRGRPLTDMFATSIAVAVSAIPEGLTIALTVILALGMQAILKKKGLVRNLLAAETLGATSVICTDKTGTLTMGEMQAVALETWTGSYEVENLISFERDASLRALLHAAVLCNDAAVPGEMKKEAAIGNATDRALMRLSLRAGLDAGAMRRVSPRIDEAPFSSATKFMATLHRISPCPPLSKGGIKGGFPSVLYVKGAPEALLTHCTHAGEGARVVALGAKERSALLRRVEALSRKGLRVLCIAQRKWTHPASLCSAPSPRIRSGEEGLSRGDSKSPLSRRGRGEGVLLREQFVLQNLTFLGFIGIEDPLRADAKEALSAAGRAGITTVMITGDHRLTATSIARDLGLLTKGKEVIDGTELRTLKPQEFASRVRNIAVYSRATPEDKLRIIEAWRKKGAVVAMTGDGVNDAPALKVADIGVALGSGTEVAKEASDIVLLEDDFKTITAAIHEGRAIFETIRTVTVYLISNSFSEMLAVSVSLLLGLPLPFLPAQILWVNMVTDSFPALALTREPAPAGIMREHPRPRTEPLVTSAHRWVISVVSVGLALFSMAVFYLYWQLFHSLTLARTMAFTVLSITTLFYIFSLRSMKESIFSIPFFRNRLLIAAVAAGLVLQAAVVYAPPLQRLFGTTPLLWIDWLLVLFIGAAFVAVIEWIKMAFRHETRKQ